MRYADLPNLCDPQSRKEVPQIRRFSCNSKEQDNFVPSSERIWRLTNQAVSSASSAQKGFQISKIWSSTWREFTCQQSRCGAKHATRNSQGMLICGSTFGQSIKSKRTKRVHTVAMWQISRPNLPVILRKGMGLALITVVEFAIMRRDTSKAWEVMWKVYM